MTMQEVEMSDDDYEGGSAGSFLAGAVIGALAGLAIGMLYAPQSGERTRRKLRKRLDEFKEDASDRADELSRRARRKLAELRD